MLIWSCKILIKFTELGGLHSSIFFKIVFRINHTFHHESSFIRAFHFQAVTVLIRNVKYYKLEADQLKTLLLYAEEDCQNDEKQANSFSLLKAILEARLVSTELHEVMEKVSKICILSESAKSR